MAGLRDWFIGKLTPPSLEEVERETRKWVIECKTCGANKNLWEAGGMRYKAYGNRTVLGRCAGCGDKLRSMKIYMPSLPAARAVSGGQSDQG